MLVDLKTDKQGEWFTFRMSHVDPDTGETIWGEPIEGVEVCIRSMRPFIEERFANRERVVEWKINPKTRQNERHSNPKELMPAEIIEERNDAYDYAITGLKGWMDKTTKKPIECNKKNKIALMAKGVFERFFSDCQLLLDSSGLEQEEQETKNSLTGSSGKTKTPDSV
jgi:hypothetical protein